MFKADLCDLCGDCLVKCPWISADKAQAVDWMKSMMGWPANARASSMHNLLCLQRDLSSEGQPL
jgi:hypothetical protein